MAFSRKKRIRYPLVLLTIFTLVFGMVYFVFLRPDSAEATWYDELYSYRKKYEITNAGSAQTDYQVALSLDTATLISGSKIQSDCDDIRVTDINGKLLPHWIQTGTNACNSSTTKIWVKVPSIPTSGQSVYLYYGNANAVNNESGKSVFSYFEDFSSIASWTAYGSGGTVSQPSAGLIQINNPSSACRIWAVPNSSIPSLGNATIELRYAITNSANEEGGPLTRVSSDVSDGAIDGYQIALRGRDINDMPVWRMDNMASGCAGLTNINSDYGTGWAVDQTFKVGKVIMNGSTQTWYPDIDNHAATSTSWTDANYASGSVGLWVWYPSDLQADWFFARTFASTEPSVGSAGSEEKGPGSVAYWRFDEGQGDTTYDDSTNNNDGTLSGTTKPAWQTGDMCVADKCLKFDGSTSYVDTVNKVLFTTEFTIESWFKANQWGSTDNSMDIILSKWNCVNSNCGEGRVDEGYYFGRFYGGANFGISINNGADGTNSKTASVAIGTISTGVWHQAIATFKGGQYLRLYIDGVLVNENTTAIYASVQDASAYTHQIGRFSHGYGYFDGFIDDVKIYPYARTAAQVKTDYASRGSTSGTSAKIGNESAWISNGLVGYWKMNEASWAGAAGEVLDASGAGNHGVRAGDATTAAGKFGNGGTFDGTGDYVDLGTANPLPDGVGTVSVWVKLNVDAYTAPTNENYLVAKGDDASLAWNPWGLDIVAASATSANLVLLYSGGWITTGNIPYSLTDWHLFTAVMRSNNVQELYLDGVLKATGSRTTVGPTSSMHLDIGKQWRGDPYAYETNGSIDEVRIYSRALSAKEVADLYNFAPGPWAYYKLDEGSGTTSVIDSSGNGNTATMNGLAASDWVTGKYGKSLQFNNSDYLRVSVNSWIRKAQDVTISGWYYHTGDTNGGPWGIMTDSGSESDGFWMHTKYSGGEFFLRTEDSTYGESDGTGTNFVSSGNWYYITTIVGTNKFNVYVNGVLNWAWTPNANFAWANINSDTAYLYIGKSYADEVSVNGKIDDVRVYNYARTQKQILEDMNAGHPSVGSPVGSYAGYWKFDEGYSNIAYDMSGNNNDGTLTAGASGGNTTAAAMWENAGKFGKALEFDGDDYVNAGANTSLNIVGNLTISAWIYLNAVGDYQVLVGKYGSGTNTPYEFRLKNTNVLTLCHEGVTSQCIDSSTALSISTWYFVTVTRDGSNVRFYLNGVADGTVAQTATPVANSNNLWIGMRNSDSWKPLNGRIDELKIYPLVLTVDEIKTEYNRGAAIKLGSVSTESDGTTASNAASRGYCVPGDTSTCNAPVGEWKMDEKVSGDSQSLNDSSGNGNTATTYDGANNTGMSCAIPGKYGSSCQFDGTDDYADAGNSTAFNSDAFTTEVWFKTTTVSPTYQSIITKSGAAADFDLQLEGSTLKFYYYSGGGSNTLTYSTAIAINAWYHIVVTNAGAGTNNLKMYVNEILGPQASPSGTRNTNSNNVQFGQSAAWSGRNFNGAIDDVKYFNYARTAAQVAWDYNRGKPVGWWKFDECQGATAYDMSDNNNDGTITIGGSGTQTTLGTCTSGAGAWYNGVSGKFNSAMSFDGTDDYVEISNNIGITGSSARSIEMWTYTKSLPGGNGVVVAGWGTAGAKEYSQLVILPAGNWYFWGSSYDYDTGVTVVLNQWEHHVVTFNGTTMNWYRNGVEIGSGANMSLLNTGDSHVRFGTAIINPHWFNEYFNGLIDDAKIYNYALTPAQIKMEYNQGSAVRFGPSSGQP